MRSLTRLNIGLIAALAVVLAVGCAQKQNEMLEEARAAYSAARSDAQVMNNAPLELNQAGESLQSAERLFNEDADQEQVSHQAYLAKQQVAIARESAQLKLAQQQIEQADARRAAVLLEARNRELQATRQKAEAHQKALETAQLQAQEREALARQEEMERLRQKAAQAEQMETQMREQQAQARQQEMERLRQQAQKAEELEAQIAQMKDLQTQETRRGLVVTLPGVLFDLDKAQLKPGAERSIDQLATVLKENPERNIVVEGFTDSTGAEEYNKKLSEERAAAVREALVSRGVNPERIQTRGYGENYPVASNETPAGRQLNRRVEIIISHGEERVSRR